MTAEEFLNLTARWMFGLSAGFHFLFVPLSIGLLAQVTVLRTVHATQHDRSHEAAAAYWSKYFVLAWLLGMLTGYPLRMQLTTYWITFMTQAAPVLEAVMKVESFLLWPMIALVLVNTFAGRWLDPRARAACCWLLLGIVTTQSMCILSVNAWMQVPAVLPHDADQRPVSERLAMLLVHPVTLNKAWHTISAAMVCGSFFVFAVAGLWTLSHRHRSVARASIGVAVWLGLAGSVSTLWSGHTGAAHVAHLQPMKFAAIEGHWRSTSNPSPLILWARPMEGEARNLNVLEIPTLGSLLRDGSLAPSPGVLDLRDRLIGIAPPSVNGVVDPQFSGLANLEEVVAARMGSRWARLSREEQVAAVADAARPPVSVLFVLFRVMVASGVACLVLCALAVWFRRRLCEGRAPTLSVLLVALSPLPWIAILCGWAVAEIGRQPWTIYGKLPTAMAGGLPSAHHGFVAWTTMIVAVAELTLLFGAAAASIWHLGPAGRKKGSHVIRDRLRPTKSAARRLGLAGTGSVEPRT
ncbi:cytochrome ubiquinol oxidase subunit I [Ideonella sp. DXS29W]|uniref:Cytochrome ubiquinol oxidase subunit I n=1 Tax=Ideonella lacteola TaxID=2984193 RepID=A0ABU9BW25_9BURK